MDEDLQKALSTLYSQLSQDIDWLRLHVSLSGVELGHPVRRGLDVLLDNRMTLWADWREEGVVSVGLFDEDVPRAWRAPLRHLCDKGRPSWEEVLTELGEWADGL